MLRVMSYGTAPNLNPTENLLGDLKMTDDIIWQIQNASSRKIEQTFPGKKVPKKLNGVLKIKLCISRVLKVCVFIYATSYLTFKQLLFV